MSTQLRNVGDMIEVSTIVRTGKQRLRARRSVLVPAGDMDALKAEVLRQAALVRSELGLDTAEERPVV